MSTLSAMPAAAPPNLEFSTDIARYQALLTRDARAEGRFFYAVATTGVYCRPTCTARLPRPENVAFYRTLQEVEAAGFRPCKRCLPRELPHARRLAEVVEAARALLESSEAPPRLAALAARVGLSAHYLHRLFKKQVGMTPREYAAARRFARVGTELRGGSDVTAAIYAAGYSSSSRFYERDSGALGMLPAEVRRGGRGVELRATVGSCSLGRLLVAATARGVSAIAFGDSDAVLLDDLRRRFPHAVIRSSDAALDALATQVVQMVDGAGMPADLPLDLIGTAFQQKVWRALRDIPRGATSSYADIARAIGAPRAVRAVGTACGKNPVAVAVPCHRVVRQDGALGGYRWGLPRKEALLARERSGPPARSR
ncbi:MAG TPA: bifunctional DNA-binding transcriptional regulator/O6-methylguanine-DNA methyltransferase Ada [Polyangia bacterium]|nr:bifunctional DNA-binding transcriptional regulator/O6-methylguanine-DNA methyltransferase Ada [Polyangia bacterium]